MRIGSLRVRARDLLPAVLACVGAALVGFAMLTHVGPLGALAISGGLFVILRP